MHIRFLLPLAVGTMLVLSACGGGGDPRPDLLFVSTRDGDYAIYGMNADGGRQERLTRAAVDTSSPSGLFFQTDPAWSPDGATIAFASRRAGTFDIYVMRADGTGTQQLTETRVDDTHPTWAPDGRRLAFKRAEDIYVMNADGTAAHAISHGVGSDGDPAWSPDGKWIAFTRRESGTQDREIWVMRPDGSDPRRMTSLHGTSINPAWSPDAFQIAFASNIVGSLYDLYLVDVTDRRVRRVTRRGPDAFGPAWSPDGSTIAFSQDGSISTTDLKGQTEALTDTKNNDSSPTWNPVPPPPG
jgi:Tol biopolymer transport system component